MVQALIMGVGLWLGLTFLAQLIPLLEKRGSYRPSSWDEPTPSHELQPTSAWDPSCRYFSHSPYLPCAVNPWAPVAALITSRLQPLGKKNKLESVPVPMFQEKGG
ncbi:hypothetical protein [Synechococcus sp. H60.4]|uniref:hypothetical protein n=1 Tax=unclassified Synechococcus TaxID=2626047 RepID=UPI0039C1C590